MTKFADLFAALSAPFDISEVKVRSQNGRQMHYITARTAMNRLDNVLGPENWTECYVPGENSVLCEITVTLPDGAKVTKSDAGGYAGMADSGDDDKSGYSDAFKRTCVKLGVGRYLYRDGVPEFVRERVDNIDAQVPQGSAPDHGTAPGARRQEPRRDAERPAQGERREQGPQGQQRSGGYSGTPKTGKALFAWCKDREQEYNVGVQKCLQTWGQNQDFPDRMVDWDSAQVELAYAEAIRKLKTVEKQPVSAN